MSVSKPRWPFTVNRDSIQAQGLWMWAAGPWAQNVWTPRNFALRERLGRWETLNTNPLTVTNDPHEGAVWSSDGAAGRGLRWNGVPTSIRTANPLVSTRIRGRTSQTTSRTAVSASDGAGAIDLGITFYWGHTNAALRAAWVISDGTYAANKYTSLSQDVWYLLGSYNASTSDWRRYLNGALEATTNPGRLPPTTAHVVQALGCADIGTGPLQRFIGDLTDYRMYDPAIAGPYADELMRVIGDPATKWDLFYELGRRKSYFPSAGVVGFQPITMVM